jgi:putative ABC transport system permease protein
MLWGVELHLLLRTVRLAVRDLLRQPGYTASTVLTLALVIAANSAIFSAVHGVLLTPSAIRQPEGLVVCWERDISRSPVVEVSYRNFQDWVAHSRSFSQAAAIGSSAWPAILDGRGESVRLASAGVSASFFDTLGVVPALGRGFRPEDDAPNAERVVVLSHTTWARRFGADPRVIGTTIQLDEPHTVVGVMPAGFDFPHRTDVWLPVVPILANAGDGRVQSPLESVGVLFVVGRLREGVTPTMVSEELNSLARRLQETGGAHRFGTDVVVTPFLDYLIGPVRYALWALLAAVGVLLLIGCANVSGLMLTRVSARRREHAIRLALGATRRHLGRHWAVETLIVSLAGGCIGLIAARWMLQVIVALAPEDVPRLTTISINTPVVAFTFLAVLATALLCGAQPVRQASTLNLFEALNEASRATPGKRSHRARSMLLVFQIGLSVLLLIAAGLVMRSFVNLRSLDLGFVPSNVLTMNVTPREARPSANEWMHELLARVSALRDVEAAGAVYLRPLALGPIGGESGVILEGQPDSEQSARLNPTLSYQVATPGYFTAMRIQLKRGRLFTDQDNPAAPRVAIVSESTARALWRGEDPLGRRILMPTHSSDGGPNVWRTVVGVVSDVRYRGIDDVRLDVYDAALQAAATAGDLVVRTSRDPLIVAGAVQAEARRLDARVVIDRLTTMDGIVSRAVAPWRFSVWMFTLFAVLAFVLATMGLVSLVSLDVAQRRREFAVRLAVGAQRGDVCRSVLVSALWRVVAGVAFGVLAAVLGTRAIRHILFGVEPVDLTTYSAVIMLVLAVVTAASWLPAHRAAGTNPLALLRREQ